MVRVDYEKESIGKRNYITTIVTLDNGKIYRFDRRIIKKEAIDKAIMLKETEEILEEYNSIVSFEDKWNFMIIKGREFCGSLPCCLNCLKDDYSDRECYEALKIYMKE